MPLNFGEFMAITIVGAFLSAFIHVVKKSFGEDSGKTKMFTVMMSLFIGGFYMWVRDTDFFQTVILVLTSASACYAFFLKE